MFNRSAFTFNSNAECSGGDGPDGSASRAEGTVLPPSDWGTEMVPVDRSSAWLSNARLRTPKH
jgi:hypothetical protein